MQGRWLVATFTVIMTVLCLHRLSHTWYVNNIEDKAKIAATQTGKTEKQMIDSLGADTLNLFVARYNYFDSKKKQLNLGLDLKGGISTILQVSVKDLLNELSDNSENPVYLAALEAADEQQKQDTRAYLEIFFDQFDQINKQQGGTAKLAGTDIFGHFKNQEIIQANISDEDAKEIIRDRIEKQVGTAQQVISSRIDQFGVSQPVVQRLGDKADGRILVELPGVKDTERVRKILEQTAELQFWESILGSPELNAFVSSVNVTVPGDSIASSLDRLARPRIAGGQGFKVVEIQNKPLVDSILKSTKLPASLKGYRFAWGYKPITDPETNKQTNFVDLFALKGNRDGTALLDGKVVTSADAERSTMSLTNEPQVSMQMNVDGSREWARITEEFAPVGGQRRYIAIVLDDLVYSAPGINEKIPSGRSQISGNFTMEEAEDLANVLEAGSLPASADIIQEAVVGPSLGKENIRKSVISFIIAFALVLVWMVLYYSRAGIYADIALIANMVFLFGILANFGAVLTLPGIAGIILTIGMAVDANVIIYERVKEELAKGKNVKQAVATAFSWKGAISAIVDANVTTFLTALILWLVSIFVSTGPVKGFALVLMIGIASSMFCAIFLTRYFISGRLENGKDVSFFTKVTEKWFRNLNFDFLSKRKIAFIISGALITISLVSLLTKSLNYGIDFVGGRNYVIQFDKDINANEISEKLATLFVDESGTTVAPEVKTFGGSNQIKITTKYKIGNDDVSVTEEIQDILFNGLKPYLPADLNKEDFIAPADGATIGIMSSNKVGPTIADDIKRGSLIAVFASLAVVFLYILLRFRKWQFSAGAVAAVFHDVLIVLGMFSLLHGLMPFSLEIDQVFIAAILTVIGYSLNDTVIVFDRIREFLEEYPKMPFGELINKAINSTLSRTINTSLTTLFVVLVIFLFGGETIAGFMFALLLGIIVGTYSSVFIATPLMYDLTKKTLKNREA